MLICDETMPLFSILLPTNKSQAEVEKSVSSCLLSVFKDFQINIGIQDWSAWRSQSPQDSTIFDQSNIKLIDSSSCSNLSSNLNHLIRSSSNSFFAVRHDDDDLMHPYRLQRLYENLSIIQKSLIVGQSYKILGDSDSKASLVINPSIRNAQNKISLLLAPCFAHPTITINLSRIKLFYDETFDYAQDYKLYVDNFYAGHFVGLVGMATYYRSPDVEHPNYRPKRLRQLSLHDQCMHKLWNLVLGGKEISLEDITLFRRKFITSEDQILLREPSLAGSLDINEIIETYNHAKTSLQHHLA